MMYRRPAAPNGSRAHGVGRVAPTTCVGPLHRPSVYVGRPIVYAYWVGPLCVPNMNAYVRTPLCVPVSDA